MAAKKIQLTVYLDPVTFGALEAFAAQRRQPKSLMAEAAIASFLTPDEADRREAVIAKRLDRIMRVLERLERNDHVTLETVALFIRFWLTATPMLSEQTTPAARASGAARYERFMESLGRRLASGSNVLRDVALDVGGEAPPSGRED